eukprot:552173-Alexandrium_andersonii.AAC.1
MSASLVGSEMCIRDRLGSGAPIAKDCADCPGGARFGRFGLCRVRFRRSICLLYTSDAADDM